MRGLAFFSHAVGTAAFPGLVLADGLGFAAPLGAFGAAVVFSLGASLLSRRDEEGRDSAVSPGRWFRTPACCCSTSLSPARPSQRRGAGSADRRAGGGGAGIAIATHDLEQARGCDLVLCINGRQVACGRPEQVLADVGELEATYGGAIVEIPGTGGRAILPPHHHHH